MDSSVKKTSNPFQLLAAVVLALVLTAVATGWTSSLERAESMQTRLASEADSTRSAIPRVDTLYGGRLLVVGQEENYRVRVKPGATWPISYRWDLGDGTRSIGNNVVHHFDRPGRYRLNVHVLNRYGSDSTGVWVYVVPRPAPTRAGDDESARTGSGASGQKNRTVPQPVTIIPHGEDTAVAYYSWVLATYLNRSAAAAAASQFRKQGIEHIRVYTDESGQGTTAYRVVSGQYRSEQDATASREKILAVVERPIILISIVSQ